MHELRVSARREPSKQKGCNFNQHTWLAVSRNHCALAFDTTSMRVDDKNLVYGRYILK